MTVTTSGFTRRGAMFAGGGAAMASLVAATARMARADQTLLGPARPTHYRFPLGEFEVTMLRDGARIMDGPHPGAGYHMPFPAVGFVEHAGESYRWAPATYQLHL